MEDTKIPELIRSGKPDKAFASLYRYFPVVKKMVLANGGNPQDAEDLYQEALLVFYKKALQPDFNLTSTISTYVYSICRYLWKDQLKKQRRFAFTEIEQQLVNEQEFTTEIENENQFKLAEKAVSGLGDRCKELLIQFYFHSKKLKDIAAKMGYSSKNTAKNQKYKCLEAAKMKLKALQQN